MECYPKMHNVRTTRNSYWSCLDSSYPITSGCAKHSSQAIGHRLRPIAQVLSERSSDNCVEVVSRHGNSSTLLGMNRSQSIADYDAKGIPADTNYLRVTPLGQNMYLHGGGVKAYPSVTRTHGMSETQSSFTPPAPATQVVDVTTTTWPYMTKAFQRDFSAPAPPVAFRGDAVLKHLDPYVTSSQFEHCPFTEQQLAACSNKDAITFYTFTDNIPRVRGPRPPVSKWWRPPPARPLKAAQDLDQFKYSFKECRTHNPLNWTPTAFLSETARSMFDPDLYQHSISSRREEQIQEFYQKVSARLQQGAAEKTAIETSYSTETKDMNSGKPICANIIQHKRD